MAKVTPRFFVGTRSLRGWQRVEQELLQLVPAEGLPFEKGGSRDHHGDAAEVCREFVPEFRRKTVIRIGNGQDAEIGRGSAKGIHPFPHKRGFDVAGRIVMESDHGRVRALFGADGQVDRGAPARLLFADPLLEEVQVGEVMALVQFPPLVFGELL